MQLHTKINRNNNLSLALGFFDGVHLGHQAVIKSAVNFAKENGLKSAVITFKNHPCCYFYNVCPKYILTSSERYKHIEDLGVDYIYELDFNEDLSKLEAKDYLENILIKNFSPKSISTGFNHFFGTNKSGNAKFLHDNQEKYGYKYFEIPPQKLKEEIISSTAIRNYLKSGEIVKANSMLGNNFHISGKVIEGQKIGRDLGFKTANTTYPTELVDIPFGVYETETQYGKGITNFGIRPTVNNTHEAVVETHILDFDKDIYGEVIDIKFKRMLRREQKFSSSDDLISQIQKDIDMIR